MRWQDREQSSHIEDRRGESPFGRSSSPFGRGTGLGSGYGQRRSGMPIPISGKSGLLLLVAVLAASFFGFDLGPLIGMGDAQAPVAPVNVPAPQRQAPPQASPGGSSQDVMGRFVSVVLRDTEKTWGDIFQKAGARYKPTTLVLYTDATETACGYGQAAMGPFYCPADQKVYLDLAFYRDMKTKLGGGGDFALGYVLAHEVGHHVQQQLGISDQMRRMQAQVRSKAEKNQLSVMLELQADCFSGIWAHYEKTQGNVQEGDLMEALSTAQAIGDDRLQRQSMGRVVPDSFTHGTSEQRYYWFKRGYDSGDMRMCNTFSSAK
ncbi:MAG: neutral zinc metallopeptidase [Desulfovibrio sp.]|nr:neutral zinc metallopeptidase [Desulfovibrio sp.]